MAEDNVPVRIKLLGGFQIFAGEKEIPADQFRLRKARTLIKVLALATRHRLHRDQLIEMLWPDAEDLATAANSLNQALYSARRVLTSAGLPAQDILNFNDEVLSLCPQYPLWIDAEAFERAASSVRNDQDLAMAACRKAIALYPGDLLPEDRYEEWAEERREALHKEYIQLMIELAQQEEIHHEYPQAIVHLRQVLSAEPSCEEAHVELMRLLAVTGQRSAALAQFDDCQAILQRELGVAPSLGTLRLYQEIREGKIGTLPFTKSPVPALSSKLPAWLIPFVGREGLTQAVREHLSDPACRLVSLIGPGGCGKTRLAVESASPLTESFPEGIFFVPLAGITTPGGLVPAIFQELGFDIPEANQEPRLYLLEFLRARRLLLILDNFEHLVESAYLIVEILQACPSVKILVTSRTRLGLLGETLLPVYGLKLPNSPPEVIHDILEFSGVRLFLEGARRMMPDFSPNSLELGSILHICQMLDGIPLSILLAASWMRLISPDEIAKRIEENCLDFLENPSPDLPERQHSLRAVFDHSWRLLDEQAQCLLACLSVFKGGFSTEAVQTICNARLTDLARLVDHSFLHRTTAGRFEQHEMLRQYGEEKLQQLPEVLEIVHEAHCEYYFNFLQKVDALISAQAIPDHEKVPDLLSALFPIKTGKLDQIDLTGQPQEDSPAQRLLTLFDLEISNIQVAWTWATQRRQIEHLRVGRGGLGQYYMGRYRFQEGEQAFGIAVESLKIEGEVANPDTILLLAEMLAWQARFCEQQFHAAQSQALILQSLNCLEQAEKLGVDIRAQRSYYLYLATQTYKGMSSLPNSKTMLSKSLNICQQIHDLRGEARALLALGYLNLEWGYYEEAEPMYQRCLEIFQELGTEYEYHHTRLYLGEVQTLMGNFEGAEAVWAETLAYFRKRGGLRGIARGLYTLGQLREKSGYFDGMIAPLEESLELYQKMHNPHESARAQMFLGFGHAHLGQYAQARKLLQEAYATFIETHSTWRSGISACWLAEINLVEGRLLEARRLHLAGIAEMRSVSIFGMHLENLATLALIELKSGEIEPARQSLALALSLAVQRRHHPAHCYVLRCAIAYFTAIGCQERALELYSLAMKIPFLMNSRLFHDQVWAAVETQALNLSPETAAAARRRGLQRDLAQTIQELSEDPLLEIPLTQK